MRIRCMVAGASLVLAGAVGCGQDAPADAGEKAASLDVSQATSTRSDSGKPAFGQQHTFRNGLSVTVSLPTSFVPSDTAYPQADRALKFEIILRNNGDQPYRLSGLSITSAVSGKRSREIIDSTQGINGIGEVARDLAVQRKLRFTVAFEAGDQPSPVRVDVRPMAGEPASVSFNGHA